MFLYLDEVERLKNCGQELLDGHENLLQLNDEGLKTVQYGHRGSEYGYEIRSAS